MEREYSSPNIDTVAIVWLDEETSENDEATRLNIASDVVREVYYSPTVESFLDHISQLNLMDKIFLIISDLQLKELLRIKSPLPTQIVAIYVLGDTWNNYWNRTIVRDVFSKDEMERLIEKLSKDFKAHFAENWLAGISFFRTDIEQRAVGELNRRNAEFMWFQLLLRVLITMPPSSKSLDELLQQAFLFYHDDPTEQKKIFDFKKNYTPSDAVAWYSKDSFVYRMVNAALRTRDIDLMFTYRFFIRDLHLHLTQLHTEQNVQEPFTVYRGSQMAPKEMDILESNVGHLICRHTFLSTTKEKNVAIIFSEPETCTDKIRVVEEIYIDPLICKSKPFYRIEQSNKGDEKETLFSIGTVFRIDSINKDENENIWYMKLTLFDNQESVTHELQYLLETEVGIESNLLTLCKLLAYTAEHSRAERYAQLLLKELPPGHFDIPPIHTFLGEILQKMNKYELALKHLNKAIELYSTCNIYADAPACRHESLARSYYHLGRLHSNWDHYNDAQTFLDLALKMRQETSYKIDELTEKRVNRLALGRAATHEVLGLMYVNKSEYHLALKNFEETLNLRQKYLPVNHFYIADIYNNFSLAHSKMGNSNESLDCLKKALDIQRQSLPSNHPNLATMINNIGSTLLEAFQYDKALPYLEEAQKIAKIAPYGGIDAKLEATIISNYASTLRLLKKYDEAAQYYKKAFSISRCISGNNLYIISLLNNIAFIHSAKKDKFRAVEYFTQAFTLCKRTLGENHMLTATAYKSLGAELDTDQYELAMDYFQRVFNIHNHLNLPYHKNVIDSLIFKGDLHRKMHEHNLALKTYKESLALAEQHYPEEHTLVARSCSYVAFALCENGDDCLPEAVIMYERVLKSIAPNHPDRARMQRYLDNVRQRSNL